MMKIMTEITGVGEGLVFSFFSPFFDLRGRERGREEEEVKVDYLIEEFLRARLEAR